MSETEPLWMGKTEAELAEYEAKVQQRAKDAGDPYWMQRSAWD